MSGPDCERCGEYLLDCECKMPSKPSGKPNGHPLIPIDWKRADELLEAGCLGTEIASFFGMHPETFYHRVEKEKGLGFTEYSSKRKATGEALIREAQYKKAIKKQDNTMLVWLGKQRLGQRENPGELEVSKETTEKYLELMQQFASLQQKAPSQAN